MQVSTLLNMNTWDAIDWLEANKNSVAIVPIKLTKEMRIAFHEAHENYENGDEIDGSPDDEWAAMLRVAESA